MTATRTDRLGPIHFGATPVLVTPEGYKHYEGTATIGDVILPYAEPDLHLEFRPHEEVACEAAVESMYGAPVTFEHPEDLLNPDTAKEHVEGAVIKAWREEGEHPRIRVRVVIYTRALQDAIEGGKVDLSPGYSCDPDATPGEFRGQRYHVVQRGVRYNHLAVVDRGRTRTPTGEVARLDKDDDMSTENTAAEESQKTRKDADRKDGLTEEGLALLAQMPPEDQKAIEAWRMCAEAEEAEEAAIEAGATPEEAEAVEAAAMGAGENENEEDDKMDKVMDMLKTMDARIAAMEKPAGAAAGAAPAARGDSIDIAKMIAASEERATAKAVAKIHEVQGDIQRVRKDNADFNGASHEDALGAMLAVVNAETPALGETFKSAVKASRLDDARNIYAAAVQVRNAKRLDSQIDAFGGIVGSMNSGADDLSGIEALPG